METKLKDLSVDQLRILISDAIKESMEDIAEDILALSNEKYLRSISEARKDYKEGRVKRFEEIFNV